MRRSITGTAAAAASAALDAVELSSLDDAEVVEGLAPVWPPLTGKGVAEVVEVLSAVVGAVVLSMRESVLG
jgi:hypothetical protein